jgi:hypothetical protein
VEPYDTTLSTATQRLRELLQIVKRLPSRSLSAEGEDARFLWEEIFEIPLGMRAPAVAELVKMGEARFARDEETGRSFLVQWRLLRSKRRRSLACRSRRLVFA